MIQYSFILTEGELSKKINELTQKRKDILKRYNKSHPISKFLRPINHKRDAVSELMATDTISKNIRNNAVSRLKSLRRSGNFEDARKLKKELLHNMPKEFKL